MHYDDEFLECSSAVTWPALTFAALPLDSHHIYIHLFIPSHRSKLSFLCIVVCRRTTSTRNSWFHPFCESMGLHTIRSDLQVCLPLTKFNAEKCVGFVALAVWRNLKWHISQVVSNENMPTSPPSAHNKMHKHFSANSYIFHALETDTLERNYFSFRVKPTHSTSHTSYKNWWRKIAKRICKQQTSNKIRVRFASLYSLFAHFISVLAL